MISYVPIIQNLTSIASHQLDVLRLDLIDTEVSGNKWFKLKQNLKKAKQENFKTILTFGGAFSNHIAATAAASKLYGFKSIGVIRGEETAESNSTLQMAKLNGMVLHFVNRETYSQKEKPEFKNYLETTFGQHYLIPEGGNNAEGILGCMEILKPEWDYNYIFCACGTATTYAGLIASKNKRQKIIGISVLKGENKLPENATRLLQQLPFNEKVEITGNNALEKEFLCDDCILNTYSFNGYAKLDEGLIDFKKDFELKYKIMLDHIYTTKLMHAVFDLAKKNKLQPFTKVLVIHSGGLQGNKGFEERYHLTPNL